MKYVYPLSLFPILLSIPASGETLSATYVGTPNGRLGYAAVESFTITMKSLPLRMESRSRVWWQMDCQLEDRSFSIRAQSESSPLGDLAFGDPEFIRYQFRAGEQEPLEYINRQTGKALPPKFGFHEYFLPRAAPQASYDESGLPRSCYYLGHAFYLANIEKAEAEIVPWPDAKRLELDPTLLVGTSRNFRDAELHRIPEPEDYTYVKFVEEEYDDMIEAGINYVIVDAEQQQWVQHRPLFYVSRTPQFPEEFYRSNYHGWLYIMDEPAVLLYEDRQVGDLIRDVRDVSTAMRSRARAEYYRLNELADLPRFEQPARIGGANVDPLRIVQEDVPYWDTINSAAYYELAEGGSGVLHEGRYNLDGDRHLMRTIFGDGIDLATDEMFLIQYAFLRGAARNFGKMWGTSIYGQADSASSPRAFEIAYDMGARWLWFWSSDHGHHLPYPEQIALAKHLRDYAAAHPRPSHDVLIKAATTVIALPDGYVLDPFVLWKFPTLSIDNPNHTGATHKDVLRRALSEAIMCIRRGEEFDFAIDTYDFIPAGYERVAHVQYDGTVVETGPVKRAYPVPSESARVAVEISPLPIPKARAADPAVLRAGFVGTSPPTIDADLADWTEAQWYTLDPDPIGSEEIHGATDLGGECTFAYDDDNLYLAVRIIDEFHAQPFSDWLLWNADCVQVGIDPLLDSTDEGYGPDDTEFGFTFHEGGGTEAWWWVSPEKTGKREGIEVQASRTETQTIYEVRIPAALIEPWSPQLTRRCGINVAVADADAEAVQPVRPGALNRKARESAIELTDSLIYRKRPDLFAVLELEPTPIQREFALMAFLGRERAANQAGSPVEFVFYAWTQGHPEAEVTVTLNGDSEVSLEAGNTIRLRAGRSRHRISVATDGVPPGLYKLTAEVLVRQNTAASRTMDVFFW